MIIRFYRFSPLFERTLRNNSYQMKSSFFSRLFVYYSQAYPLIFLLILFPVGLQFKIVPPCNIYIDIGTTGYYQFKTSFDFLNCDIKLKYYDADKAKNCMLCKYTNVGFSDSSKRDVIITFAAKKVTNIALLQRTLRTTKSNASLVILLDRTAINSIDERTFQFFENCSTQIVLMPDVPYKSRHFGCKNYLITLMYLFLLYNRFMIDRVIFVDLYDSIFQADPFNPLIRKHEIHAVRELLRNREHRGKLNWPRCYFPNFDWKDPNEFQINSGYFGGYIDEMLCFLNVYSQNTKYNNCPDQGLVNIIYNWDMLEPYHVKFSDIFPNERVLMASRHKLKKGFPYCQGNYQENITATIIHLYYKANLDFQRSVLKHCPRPYKTMTSYLSKIEEIDDIERSLENWDQNSVTNFI